jgi:cytochrome c peroxidase
LITDEMSSRFAAGASGCLGGRRMTEPGTRAAPAVTVLLLTAWGAAGCGPVAAALAFGDRGGDFSPAEWDRVVSLANLGAPELDRSNRYIGDENAIALGHRLYFSPDFSGEARWEDTLGRNTTSAREPRGVRMKISCATCHDPSRAGSDFTSTPGNVSEGAGWYDVNGQQSLNAAHYPLLYWNGRSDSLWSQAAAVMESPVSMNGNRVAIVRVVADKHRGEYQEVFGEPLPALARLPESGKPGEIGGCQSGDATEPFGDVFDCLDESARRPVNRAFSNVAKAIAAYEWELRSGDAPFDRFVNGDEAALSARAIRGLRLFIGGAACLDCHSTPLFSDGRFHNIGIPQRGPGVPTEADCPRGSRHCDCQSQNESSGVVGETCLPWGYHSGLVKLRNTAFRRDGEYSDDPVAGRATHGRFYEAAEAPDPSTRGAWRTPSLRDVALTAPYMHNGIYRTLDEVLWHYDQGGTTEASGRKCAELRPLLLSAQDRSDLVEFLQALTGVPARPELHRPPQDP